MCHLNTPLYFRLFYSLALYLNVVSTLEYAIQYATLRVFVDYGLILSILPSLNSTLLLHSAPFHIRYRVGNSSFFSQFSRASVVNTLFA